MLSLLVNLTDYKGGGEKKEFRTARVRTHWAEAAREPPGSGLQWRERCRDGRGARTGPRTLRASSPHPDPLSTPLPSPAVWPRGRGDPTCDLRGRTHPRASRALPAGELCSPLAEGQGEGRSWRTLPEVLRPSGAEQGRSSRRVRVHSHRPHGDWGFGSKLRKPWGLRGSCMRRERRLCSVLRAAAAWGRAFPAASSA